MRIESLISLLESERKKGISEVLIYEHGFLGDPSFNYVNTPLNKKTLTLNDE